MKYTLLLMIMFVCSYSKAQVIMDLSIKKGSNQTISINENNITLINCSIKYGYKVEWDFVQNLNPPFEIKESGGASSASGCTDQVKSINKNIITSVSEDSVKKYVDLANELIPNLSDVTCKNLLKSSIVRTQIKMSIPYAPLKNNQVITVTITKVDKETGNPVEDGKWTFVLKTPEKSRWLVHYGLTYTPSIISKTDHYYSLADTNVANKFTITKENNNGPRPWENISATINFTYPFHADPKGVDLGFTAGFGLSAGLELSGQAGLSMIIGDNVILGSGIVMMQKYKLMGKYKNGQIIKENLEFNSLHDKVWLPELYFTLGFRFGNNPFAKKAAEPATAPAEAPAAATRP